MYGKSNVKSKGAILSAIPITYSSRDILTLAMGDEVGVAIAQHVILSGQTGTINASKTLNYNVVELKDPAVRNISIRVG